MRGGIPIRYASVYPPSTSAQITVPRILVTVPGMHRSPMGAFLFLRRMVRFKPFLKSHVYTRLPSRPGGAKLAHHIPRKAHGHALFRRSRRGRPIAKLEEAVYVLHCFQKKAQATNKQDKGIAEARYRAVVSARKAQK